MATGLYKEVKFDSLQTHTFFIYIMLNKSKRYSRNDEEVILNCIKNSPWNLRAAFELAAETLQRTTNSVAQRWYTKLKHEDQVFSVNAQFNLAHFNLRNGKNMPRRLEHHE